MVALCSLVFQVETRKFLSLYAFLFFVLFCFTFIFLGRIFYSLSSVCKFSFLPFRLTFVMLLLGFVMGSVFCNWNLNFCNDMKAWKFFLLWDFFFSL